MKMLRGETLVSSNSRESHDHQVMIESAIPSFAIFLSREKKVSRGSLLGVSLNLQSSTIPIWLCTKRQ